MDRDPYVQIFFQEKKEEIWDMEEIRDMKELCLKYWIAVCPKNEPTRQMVLGTTKRRKPPWRLTSHGSRVAWYSFLVSKSAPISGSTPSTKANSVCPLVETEGEFGPTQVHKPFSLLELRQIKQDLGSYTDDPGKYIDAFQHITLAFDLTWKDIMVIFSQTSSDPECARVLKEARRYAMELHMLSNKYPVGKLQSPSQILTGIIMTLRTSGKGILFWSI